MPRVHLVQDPLHHEAKEGGELALALACGYEYLGKY